MASSQEYHDYVLELLADVDGIRTRKMMASTLSTSMMWSSAESTMTSCCSNPSSAWTRSSRTRSADCPTKARRR